jgi:hypothetical protein
MSNGNLTATRVTGTINLNTTVAFNTGRYYWEIYVGAKSTGMIIGVTQPSTYTGNASWRSDTGGALVGSASSAYGVVSLLTGALNVTWAAGDLIGVAFDITGSTMQFFKNGVSVFSASWAPTSGAYYTPWVQLLGSGDSVTANFGQRAWAYTPPQGFNALTTKNLPRLTANTPSANPNQFFDTVLYTGNGTNSPNALTISSLNFQPDLVWIKNRTSATDNWLQDTVRGLGYALNSNTTSIDIVTGGGDVSAVNSTGFVVSYANSRTNASANNYVAWCWKAGGTAVSNTSGTITSQVSANTTSGFSIIGYTGTGVMSQTIGHGLGVAPSVVIFKNRTTGSTDWNTYAPSTSGFTRLKLNTSAADYVSYPITVSSTTITLPAINDVAFSSTSNNYIVYAWAEIAGFSKFGTYTGNGSTDGTFIYCGFKPRWIMVKEATGTNAATGSWQIFDTARDLGNPSDNRLKANVSDAEAGSAPSWDVVSNGFKLRSTNSNWNESAGVYFYMAFAGSPFGNVNGTAR